jgi:hypothetical protein
VDCTQSHDQRLELTIERYGSHSKSKDHTRRREYHNLATTNDVDVFQGNERENEVGPGNDQSDGRRLVKPDTLEQRSGIVHERVKAAKLLECLEAACDNESSAVYGDSDDASESLHECSAILDVDTLLDSCTQNLDLKTDSESN